MCFQQDSERPFLFFKTAGFNRSPTPPFTSITCNRIHTLYLVLVLAWHPDDAKDILVSGYAQGTEKLARKAAAVTFTKDKVVLFGFRVQHRAQTEGTFQMLFNAINWAGSLRRTHTISSYPNSSGTVRRTKAMSNTSQRQSLCIQRSCKNDMFESCVPISWHARPGTTAP